MNRVVASAPGRLWCASPAWAEEGASVLFDSNSGDYWVVPIITRNIILQLARSGPCAVAGLADALRQNFATPTTPDALASVLDDLAEQSLVVLKAG